MTIDDKKKVSFQRGGKLTLPPQTPLFVRKQLPGRWKMLVRVRVRVRVVK